MNRVEDITEALEKIRKMEAGDTTDDMTDDVFKAIHLAMLMHIATCLAVIADNNNRKNWIKLHTVFGNEPVMVQIKNISSYQKLANRTVVNFVGGSNDNHLDVLETPVEIRELIKEVTK